MGRIPQCRNIRQSGRFDEISIGEIQPLPHSFNNLPAAIL